MRIEMYVLAAAPLEVITFRRRRQSHIPNISTTTILPTMLSGQIKQYLIESCMSRVRRPLPYALAILHKFLQHRPLGQLCRPVRGLRAARARTQCRVGEQEGHRSENIDRRIEALVQGRLRQRMQTLGAAVAGVVRWLGRIIPRSIVLHDRKAIPPYISSPATRLTHSTSHCGWASCGQCPTSYSCTSTRLPLSFSTRSMNPR